MVTFTRIQSTHLYVSSAAVSASGAYSIVFRAPTSTMPEGDFPDSYTLEASWAQRGIYLFLNASLTGDGAVDPQQLSDRIDKFLTTPSVRNTRFLWIENPADPLFRWKFHAVAGVAQGDSLILERLVAFDFRNYRLVLTRYVICRLNTAENEFVFSHNPSRHNVVGGEAEPGKRDAFYLSTSYGDHRLRRLTENEDGGAITLPMGGSKAGCLAFPLTLQNPSPGTQPFHELAQMNIGLQMFFKSGHTNLIDTDPFSGFAAFNKSEDYLIAHHRYPFLAEAVVSGFDFHTLTLNAVLDVLNPLDSDRTYFTFVEPANAATSDLSLPSCFRTNLGYTIHVTPHGNGQSKLFFAERPGQNSRNAIPFEVPLYLVPQGAFTLSVPRYQQAEGGSKPTKDATGATNGNLPAVQKVDNFLCGLAGIEYIQLSSDHINILHFQPGKAAFAPDFSPGQVTGNGQVEQHLTETATTAWAYIEYVKEGSELTPIYFSQPQQSLLYRAPNQDDGDDIFTNDPLRFLDVPVTRLPTEHYLPLFPYGGVAGDLAAYRQMEEQLLNPQRRRVIRDLVDPLPLQTPEVPDQKSEGTTPQGLLATYSAGFETLEKLVLAKDTDKKDINFADLERHSPLRSAFQSSQLFLVVANPNSLQEINDKNPPKVIKSYFPGNKLTIQGWTFDLDPNNWRTDKGESNTVLIFKFLDKPLLDILKDTALWEQPSHFVGADQDIEALRERLVRYFETAIATTEDDNAAEKDKDNAAPLARIATSTFWAGMVALNVNLPTGEGLTAEIRALECGIKDGDNFYAQYVGSNGTPVVPRNQQLEAEQSSLFGLLDYQDNSVPEVGPSGYGFQVASLRVQFQNSEVSAFSSEVNLTLDRLFGETTLLLNSRSNRNIVILKGFTEEHDGITTYAFSFSGENYFALPQSHVLNTVDIVKAEFATDPISQEGTIGRFTLWGRFNFKAIEALDLLSFGLDLQESEVSLSFADFQNNPREIALEALEYLDRKGRLDSQGNELSLAAQEAIEKAQAVVEDYAELIASGEKLSSSTQTIYTSALKALQDLRTHAPAVLVDYHKAKQLAEKTDLDDQALEMLLQDDQFLFSQIRDETVRLAVRASQVDQALEILQKNDQFLPFSKLVIVMKCNHETDPEFTFDPSQIGFDLAKSQARAQSLYAKFPLKLVGFVHLDSEKASTKPKGFVTVKTPLGGSSMPENGFGLNFELNLGSLGALAGAAKFVANLMVAWEPNSDGSQEKPKLFVGFRLPGIGGDVLGFPLQSVIKFTFKSVELIRDSGSEKAAYLLKIKKIALKLFVLSFPRSGQTEVVIFGNPDANDSTDSNNAIGWYAAYAKEKPPLPDGQTSGRTTQSRR